MFSRRVAMNVLAPAMAVLLVGGIGLMVVMLPDVNEAQASKADFRTTDTCPQGTLLHSGAGFSTSGRVCLPGWKPTQKQESEELVKEGRQR